MAHPMPFLFERLDPAPFDLHSAVRAQVERIVSARLVDASDDQQFGMPSVIELSSSDKAALETYARRLRRLIGLYEPRLRHPTVELMAQSDAMMPHALIISGSLDTGAAEERFQFSLARGGGR